MSDPGTADEDAQVNVTIEQRYLEALHDRYGVARDGSEAIRFAVHEVLNDDDPVLQVELVDRRDQ